MATKKVNKKTVLNKKGLFFLLILFSGFLFFNCFQLLKIFIENKNSKEKTYTSSSSVIYSVNVDTNNYIKNSSLESGRSYITSITKGINFTFDYELLTELVLPINYQYSIKATLYGLYNEDPTSETNPVLWNKEYVIKADSGLLSSNTNSLSIVEAFTVDVKSYITELIKFVDYFQIPTISYIKIEMPITIYGTDGTYTLSKKYNISIKIDVEDKVFFVEPLESITDKGYVSLEKTNINNIDVVGVIIYLIGFLAALIVVLIVIKRLLDYKELINYEEKLEKIKSDYSEIIVLTNSMVDTKKMKIISIISFEELLNLAANLSSPVMEFEDVKETNFYVIKNEILYLFVLKKKDYNKKK